MENTIHNCHAVKSYCDRGSPDVLNSVTMKVGEERAANMAAMRPADDGTVNLNVKQLLNTCKLLIVQAFWYSISTVSELVWEMSMTYERLSWRTACIVSDGLFLPRTT